MATSKAQQAAIAISMKKAGKKPKALKKAKVGTTVKKQCPPDCGAPNSAEPTSPIKNLLAFLGAGSAIGAATKISNSEKANAKANARADIRDAKRLERKSNRREKKGFQPISGPSFGAYKKGGTLRTKKK
jgi:hypothetical protein